MHLFDFSPLHFQMLTQRAWIKAGKVTLVAFVRLFPTVCFQTNLRRACLRGCKVTFVAFVWLSPTVCLQMYPQSACPRGCIVTLVAFVWLFSSIGFQMFPQITFFIIIFDRFFHSSLLNGCFKLRQILLDLWGLRTKSESETDQYCSGVRVSEKGIQSIC